MKELISKLVSDANIDEATAEKVIKIVSDFLDDKLPSPIDKQVTKALSSVDSDQVNDLFNKAKSLF